MGTVKLKVYDDEHKNLSIEIIIDKRNNSKKITHIYVPFTLLKLTIMIIYAVCDIEKEL